MAYLTEQYQYFENIESDDFSFGKSESLIAKMDFGYQLLESIKVEWNFRLQSYQGFWY